MIFTEMHLLATTCKFENLGDSWPQGFFLKVVPAFALKRAGVIKILGFKIFWGGHGSVHS